MFRTNSSNKADEAPGTGQITPTTFYNFYNYSQEALTLFNTCTQLQAQLPCPATWVGGWCPSFVKPHCPRSKDCDPMHAAHTLSERTLLSASFPWHPMGDCAPQTGQGRCALGKLQSGATQLQWLLLHLTTCPHFHKCIYSHCTFFQNLFRVCFVFLKFAVLA